MRVGRQVFIFCSLFVLFSLVAAVQRDSSDKRLDARRLLLRDKTTESASETSKKATTAHSSSKASKTDSKSHSGSKKTGKTTGSQTGTKTGSKTGKSKTQSSISIDSNKPAGSVNMITPNPTGSATYVKIGHNATFKWNYTNVQKTPKAIDVVAFCSENDHSYTIASNRSAKQTSLVWDTRQYATGAVRLLTAKYTMMIYDAAKGPSGTAGPGELGTGNNQFTFAMYWPQSQEPLTPSDSCPTCNFAAPFFPRHTLQFVFGMVGITIFSFTWFAGDFGVFS